MTLQKVNSKIVEILKKENVEYVFGLPGGHNCAILYDALYGETKIKPILSRHEGAASFIAFGYSYVTGKVGFLSVAPGPGWAQAVPGIHEARGAKIPMIVLAGDVSSQQYGKGTAQEIPVMQSMTPVCKWSYSVNKAETIPWVFRRAFSLSLNNPPGPVFINIPIDIGQEEREFEEYKRAKYVLSQADPRDIEKASEILLNSKKPIVIVGRGILASKAYEEIRIFIETLGCPILTTNSGKGAIDEYHPLYAGSVGINATDVSKKVYEESDCMFWIGSQIEQFAAGDWDPIPEGKKFIHADADVFQIGRNWNPDVALVGDAKLILLQLINNLSGKGKNRYDWKKILKEAWDKYNSKMDSTFLDQMEVAHPYWIIKEINNQIDKDGIIVLGEGANRVWTATYSRVRTPGNWVSASDYGCMGLSVAAAIGVKLGKPGSQVICITGDGSFQMQMQELAVAVEYKLPITWVVLNNNSLGWIKWIQKEFHGGRYISVDYKKNWKFDKVAEAIGSYGFKAETNKQFSEALNQALKVNEEGYCAVIDVYIPDLDFTPGFLEHQSSRFKD